jgi:hypothetical protein
LNGKSTPTYVTGTYQGPRGSGTFALLVQPTGASPVESFCGTFVSVAITNATPNLFAATALPGGDAICVGAGAAWLGSMDATGNLYCPSVGGGLYHGNVNADGGDNWQSNSDNQGNINDYGTWTLAPCEGSTPDAGVSSDLGNDQDAGASLSMDAGVAEGGGVPVDGGLD